MLTLVLAACSRSSSTPPGEPAPAAETAGPPARAVDESGQITIAFAGDTHFELHLARLLDRPRGALGPISRTLRRADLAMLNLESAVTERGTRDPKELEDADNRFHFRTSARALDALAASGIDVVSLANNHVGDYGAIGMADTLAAARRGPLAVVGIGRNEAEAFTPTACVSRGSTSQCSLPTRCSERATAACGPLVRTTPARPLPAGVGRWRCSTPSELRRSPTT